MNTACRMADNNRKDGGSMKNVICNAFAFKEDYLTSMQMGGKTDQKLLDIYMKNIFVSLKSARIQNPQDDVMLVTNADLPEQYQMLFKEHEIQVRIIPYDIFVMPKQFCWSLAFFKLCALHYLTGQTAYEHILLMDADTITMKSYEELWKEADYGVLLYGVGHSLNHHDRQLIMEDYHRLYPEGKSNIVHYGGEFICGRRTELQEFVKICLRVYNTMRDSGYNVSERTGDETVWSIAAAQFGSIVNAAPYIYRFWTEEFYLVSTVTVSNPVAIWHIPSEKKTGFVRMFYYYEKHGAFPDAERAAQMLGIVRAKRPFNRYTLANKIQGKLAAFRKQ